MKYNRLILAHNLGTNGNMAVIYDEFGHIVSSWFSSYKVSYMHKNRVEQNPNDWWNAICESTRKVLRNINEKEISVVTFSGQMMGLTCLDKMGNPIRNSIIWADMRSEEEANYLRNQIDQKQFYHITGHRISSAYSLSKLLWLMRNEPENYEKIDKIMQSKDYIVYKLTGNILTDYSDASGTNLFNLKKRNWSRTILSILDLKKDILPDVVSSTEIAGKITFEAAEKTGLLPGTPVVIGAGDGVCATVSAGCGFEEPYLYYGSSAWIGYSSKEPIYDKAMSVFNWANSDDKSFVPCGTMQSAGISLDWIKNQIALEEETQAEINNCIPQEILDQKASLVSPGSNGLIFLPYLNGERSPYWNSNSRGAFLGLSANSSRNELFRAVYEGIALNLKIIKDCLNTQSIENKPLVLIGGQSNSKFNCKLVSDVLNVTVKTHNHIKDCKTFGAAIIGGTGIGLYDSVDISKELVSFDNEITPNKDVSDFYENLYPIFKEAYFNILKTSESLVNLKTKGELNNE